MFIYFDPHQKKKKKRTSSIERQMSSRRRTTKNPRPASTVGNEGETGEPRTKHHRAEMVRMQTLIDQLAKVVDSLSSQLKESQELICDGMTLKSANKLFAKYPRSPLKALWEALHDKQFPGPEPALAIATHNDCGMERKWDDDDLKLKYNRSHFCIRWGARPLHLAACARRPDVVAAFLSVGAIAGAKDRYDITALHFAALIGDLVSVQALLASGKAEANEKDSAGKTPLDYAAANGHLDVVEILYSFITSLPNQYLLHGAARENNISLLKALIEIGAGVEARNKNHSTLLHVAVYYGAIDCVRALCAGGADCDAVDEKGRTALHIAVLEKNTMISELLKEGASPTLLDKSGRAPLHYAAMNRPEEAIKSFPQHCIDFPCEFQFTPLHYAIRSGNQAAVEALLGKGANTETRDGNGWTLLQLAVWKGNMFVASHLIKGGADITMLYEEDGLSLLHVAAAKGYVKVIEALLDAKADCEARCNRKGYTPLHYAAKGKHLAVIKVLLGKGARFQEQHLYDCQVARLRSIFWQTVNQITVAETGMTMHPILVRRKTRDMQLCGFCSR